MDNLHLIAGSQQNEPFSSSVAQTLATALDDIKHSQVLVIASAISPNAVDKCLRTPDRLRYEIEIPIPDANARSEILKILHRKNGSADSFEALAQNIGERTHGYVGRDLELLYCVAQDNAIDRYMESITTSHIDGNLDGKTPNDGNALEHVASGEKAASSQADGADNDKPDVEVSQEDLETALLRVRPTAMKEVFLETPKVAWSEIGGSEGVKQALNEVIEWPLKRKGRMESLNLTPQKGILLYGPPGCSKTLTAKAIATSSGLNFLAVKGAELTSMYVGESERAIREVFRKARAASPSIIFFDEIDSIGAERDSTGTKGLNVLTTILNEMDGIESLKGVLVLAATNKPEVLDPALLRPGRFDSLMYIGPPNMSARREILSIRTRNVALAPDVDLDDIAQRTEGYSGAEMVAIYLEAARETMRRSDGNDEKDVVVSAQDFETALGRAVRRITPEMIEQYSLWRDSASKA